eukprot:Skav224339  [mRNA]  locus=scaffold2411:1775:2548:- [translate_table: standard]
MQGQMELDDGGRVAGAKPVFQAWSQTYSIPKRLSSTGKPGGSPRITLRGRHIASQDGFYMCLLAAVLAQPRHHGDRWCFRRVVILQCNYVVSERGTGAAAAINAAFLGCLKSPAAEFFAAQVAVFIAAAPAATMGATMVVTTVPATRVTCAHKVGQQWPTVGC